MRIGIVYDCLFPFDSGGGERVYRAMADRLTDRGHDVGYVTREHVGGYPGVTFDVVEVSRGAMTTASGDRTTAGAMRFAWGVFRHLSRNRAEYDLLIVSALPVLTLLAARSATCFSGVTLVADWLEVWPWRKWRQYSGFVVGTVATILQWCGARATRFTTVNSRFTASRLIAIDPRADPLVLGLFDLAPDAAALKPPVAPPVALYVGRWIPDKRVDCLPAAIVHARSRVPGLRGVIVGGGAEESAIRRAISAVSAEEFIQLVGRVDDAELEELLSTAAVVVNPSVREGFGLVVTEAARHGTPMVVVAGEDNASVELVSVGVNGFVAADASPAILGDAVADAVLSGGPLRDSSAAWFAAMRSGAGLDRSLDAILALRRSAG